MKPSRNLPFILSIACALAVVALFAAPAAAQLGCLVCDNNQCRELTKHTEQEIGFPDCIDGVGPNGPFCFVMGFPCDMPSFQASLLDEPAMSPLQPAPACGATQTLAAPTDLERRTAEAI